MPIVHGLGNKFAHRLWVLHQNSLWIAFAADEAQIRGKPRPLLALSRNGTRYNPDHKPAQLHFWRVFARWQSDQKAAPIPVSARWARHKRRTFLMDILLQQIINGLVLGSMYALIALGYTMVYGIIQLINFAAWRSADDRCTHKLELYWLDARGHAPARQAGSSCFWPRSSPVSWPPA